MKKFSIVSKDDRESLLIAKDIQRRLFNGAMCYSEKSPDIVCVVGGDGAFLTAVHKYINILDQVVFAGINTGTLGFFIDYTVDEIDQYINDILNKEPQIERRRLLQADVKSDKGFKSYLGINEIRVENMLRTQTIDVYINDEKLETFRGSGLCICSQAGSTAYNRALKGAVIERGLELLQLVEVTGIHHAHYRSLGAPLVLSSGNTIVMKSDYAETSLLCFDRYAINLKGADTVTVSLSDVTFGIAHYEPVQFIKNLSNLF